MQSPSTTETFTAASVAIGSDHAGFALKQQLAEHLRERGIAVHDLGAHDEARVDYPDFGNAVSRAVLDGVAPLGIVVCGTGIGISISCNRHKGIRCALAHDITTARLAREHNDANVLALGARIVGLEVARDCVDTFLATAFAGGRHGDRVAKLG